MTSRCSPGHYRISVWCGIVLLCGLLGAFLGGCASRPAFRADKLTEMDRSVEKAIADAKCPGGMLWVEHAGTRYHKAYGSRALVPAPEPMTEDTIFDAASTLPPCENEIAVSTRFIRPCAFEAGSRNWPFSEK